MNTQTSSDTIQIVVKKLINDSIDLTSKCFELVQSIDFFCQSHLIYEKRERPWFHSWLCMCLLQTTKSNLGLNNHCHRGSVAGMIDSVPHSKSRTRLLHAHHILFSMVTLGYAIIILLQSMHRFWIKVRCRGMLVHHTTSPSCRNNTIYVLDSKVIDKQRGSERSKKFV